MLVAVHQSHTHTHIGDISSENDILYENDKNESQPSRLKWMAHIKTFNKVSHVPVLHLNCHFRLSLLFHLPSNGTSLLFHLYLLFNLTHACVLYSISLPFE
jgi:hypothetical protein